MRMYAFLSSTDILTNILAKWGCVVIMTLNSTRSSMVSSLSKSVENKSLAFSEEVLVEVSSTFFGVLDEANCLKLLFNSLNNPLTPFDEELVVPYPFFECFLSLILSLSYSALRYALSKNQDCNILINQIRYFLLTFSGCASHTSSSKSSLSLSEWSKLGYISLTWSPESRRPCFGGVDLLFFFGAVSASTGVLFSKRYAAKICILD